MPNRGFSIKSHLSRWKIFTQYLPSFICILLSANDLYSQEKKIVYSQQNLAEVFQSIEAITGLTFNYDSEELARHDFSGKLSLKDPSVFLPILLKTSPFDYEVQDETVLIFQPPPKIYRFCGYLKDASSKSPLSFANIFTDNYTYGVQSDGNGYFELMLTAPKNQLVTISYIGYQSQTKMIQEWGGEQHTNCTVILMNFDDSLMGSEVIVKDYLLDGITEGGNYSAIDINYEQLGKHHTNFEHDILKMIQLLPGITSIDESAANIQIRGGTADQNLVLWEGATLYSPGHLFGMISNINPFVVDEIKVFKGVYDPKYDNRVGGIVDISLGDSITSRISGGLGTTLTEIHGFIEVPIWKNQLSVLLSGRNSLYNFWETPTFRSYSKKVFQETKITDTFDEKEANQKLSFFDWNAKVLFRPHKNILIKAGLFKSQNELDYQSSFLGQIFETSDRVLFQSNAANLAAEISWSSRFKSKLNYTSSAFKDDYIYEINNIEDDVLIDNQVVFNKIEDNTFQFTSYWQATEHITHQFGYDYNQKNVQFDLIWNSVFEGSYTDLNLASAQFHNFFTSIELDKSNWLINAGLRATYYKDYSDWNFSPRLNIQKAISSSFKWRFSLGILQQYISQLAEFGDTDLGINNQVWAISQDESESFQQAIKLASGFVFHRNGWLIDIEGYYHKTDGLTTIAPVFNTNIDLPETNFGDSKAIGLDFLIKKRWKNYHLWTNYSLGKVLYNFKDLSDTPFPGSNDMRHNLSIIHSYQLKNWIFSLSYQFRSGLPYSLPDRVEGFENDDDDIYYEIIFEDYNQFNLKNYGRLDAGIRFQPKLRNNQLKAEFSLSIINLLNRNNVFSREFYLIDFDETDLEPELYELDRILLNRTIQSVVRFWF